MINLFIDGNTALTPDNLKNVISTIDLTYEASWKQLSYDQSDNGGLKYYPSPTRISIFPIPIPENVDSIKLSFTSFVDSTFGLKVGYYFLTANDFNIANSMLYQSSWLSMDKQLDITVPLGAKFMGICIGSPKPINANDGAKIIKVQTLINASIGNWLKIKSKTN